MTHGPHDPRASGGLGAVSGMPAEVPVTVMVDPERFADAVRALWDAGLSVDAEHPRLGTVSGRVAADRIPELETIDGVRVVERKRRLTIPPPDSPIQ